MTNKKTTQTEAKAKKATSANGQARKADKKLSQIDAAVEVLRKAGEPKTCRAMVEAISAKGLWTSPAGKTPATTLYAAKYTHAVSKRLQCSELGFRPCSKPTHGKQAHDCPASAPSHPSPFCFLLGGRQGCFVKVDAGQIAEILEQHRFASGIRQTAYSRRGPHQVDPDRPHPPKIDMAFKRPVLLGR